MNPFYIREIPVDAPFCGRKKELAELVRHAESRMNVVLYSPRRFGKTSLARRVMETLRQKAMTALYVDLVKVTSVDDLVERMAARTFEQVLTREPLYKKALRFLKMWRPVLRPDRDAGVSVSVEPVGGRFGETLLEDTLAALQAFSESERNGCYVVLDEFQDIANLPDSENIEGHLRSQIQKHSRVSYLFVGSRRRLLADMFRDKNRAFFQSALLYPLPPIPEADFFPYLRDRFQARGKNCPIECARRITGYAQGYPYYTQKLAYLVFEIAGRTVKDRDVREGARQLLQSERTVFEVMAQALAPQQMSLLLALAREPAKKLFAPAYMARHHLKSIGGLQGAIEKLLELDYIEKTPQRVHRLVDPIFREWLSQL